MNYMTTMLIVLIVLIAIIFIFSQLEKSSTPSKQSLSEFRPLEIKSIVSEEDVTKAQTDVSNEIKDITASIGSIKDSLK